MWASIPQLQAVCPSPEAFAVRRKEEAVSENRDQKPYPVLKARSTSQTPQPGGSAQNSAEAEGCNRETLWAKTQSGSDSEFQTLEYKWLTGTEPSMLSTCAPSASSLSCSQYCQMRSVDFLCLGVRPQNNRQNQGFKSIQAGHRAPVLP
jgi:hypothetical protein